MTLTTLSGFDGPSLLLRSALAEGQTCRTLDDFNTLAARYSNRAPDLADLCIIRLSEMNPRHPVITVDMEDFRVYRRNRREAIPLICPPG